MGFISKLIDGPTDDGRRKLLRAAPVLIAMPAIVKVANLMPISAVDEPFKWSPFYTDVPTGLFTSADLSADLMAITRKAFVPQLFAQLWRQSDLFDMVTNHG